MYVILNVATSGRTPTTNVLHNNRHTSSWSITLMVVVGYGMQHASGADLAN